MYVLRYAVGTFGLCIQPQKLDVSKWSPHLKFHTEKKLPRNMCETVRIVRTRMRHQRSRDSRSVCPLSQFVSIFFFSGSSKSHLLR